MYKKEKCLTPGYRFDTAARTITEADLVNFSGLSNDWDPLHVNQVFAESGPFGRRIAHGQLTASIVTGLRSELDNWPILSYLGTSRRFKSPVGPGDTIHAQYSLMGVRPTSNDPDKLVVTLGITIVDQDGHEVMNGDDVLLVDGRKVEHE